MGMLLASTGALSTFYPDAKNLDDPIERYLATIRLIAKMLMLAAFSYRHSMGLPYVYPDNDLWYPANFMSMLYKMAEAQYDADPRLAALDVLSSSCRPRAELLDQRRAQRWFLPGRPVLACRRHRRPLRPVPRWCQRSGAQDARPHREGREHPGLPRRREGPREKLMGFGHRVYKNYDPRARIIKNTSKRSSSPREQPS